MAVSRMGVLTSESTPGELLITLAPNTPMKKRQAIVAALLCLYQSALTRGHKAGHLQGLGDADTHAKKGEGDEGPNCYPGSAVDFGSRPT